MTERGLCVVAFALMVAACRGGHHHGPSTNTNMNSLDVEIWTRGDHGRVLRRGAGAGLSRLRFVRTVDGGGEIEVEAEVTRLDTRGNTTACSVKVLVVRLPQHDLLGIADGSGRAGGTDDDAENDCIEQVTTTLVHSKVSLLLQRRLAAKR